ncbi:hypothetical protein AAGF08_11110 [Algoriphagus sp. SE2]|uniref:hypothetical protein n=1 Tax=Algoriphagus sp. SE2 TaxID=3141536 RepID=UPI0031CD2C57
MLKTAKRINSYRKYSEDFKRKLVEDHERGVMSVPQMQRSNFQNLYKNRPG